MWNRAGIWFLLLVADIYGEQQCDPAVELRAKAYAKKFPNPRPRGISQYSECLTDDIEWRSKQNNKINGQTDDNNLDWIWPNGTMYYTIAANNYTSDQISKIKSAIAKLVELTKVNGKPCIQIVPRQSMETDYVEVLKVEGCSSDIGRKKGRQQLSLVDNCLLSEGTIIHEFLHAFGFDHEQSRHDRDDWVEINRCNINKGMENNFDKLSGPHPSYYGSAYDYESVMHYEAYAFANDSSIPTTIPRVPDVELKYRNSMSASDIKRVRTLYKCIAPPKSRFFEHLDGK